MDVAGDFIKFRILFAGRFMGQQKSEDRDVDAPEKLRLFMDAIYVHGTFIEFGNKVYLR